MTKTSAIIVIKKFFLVAHAEKIFCGVDDQLLSKTNIHLRPTARVYELNLNWHTLKIFLPALNWASDLKLSILLGKMRRIRRCSCSSCCCSVLFRRLASDKFQGDISWTITWIFLLNCLSLKYVLSDDFRWKNLPVHQNKLKMCLRLSSACMIYLKSLKTVPSDWAMIEIIFTRPMTIYNSSEPINSAAFSKAKPLRSPRLVQLN